MREIRTEIEIAAPRSKVWSILTDFDKWQEWSPTVQNSGGSGAVGAKLSMTMCGKEGKEGKPGPRYAPEITIFDEPKKLQWTATMMAGFVFTNGKIVELEETSSGTRLVHIETFSGLMVPMMWKHMETGVPPMLDAMNKALKDKAEK